MGSIANAWSDNFDAERVRKRMKQKLEGASQQLGQIGLSFDEKPEASTSQIFQDLERNPEPYGKDTNPKDAVGVKKVPMSTVPARPVLEMALGMLEGARKYGRHNYREAGVRASVYYDATFRHLMSWWEGEDIDPDSGLSHIVKAMASLLVLRDSMLSGNWVDDRPPRMEGGAGIAELNEAAAEIIEKYPNPKDAFTEKR